MGLIAVILVSLLIAIFIPMNNIFKGIATFPAIASLLGAVVQMLKDMWQHERSLEVQKNQHAVDIGFTSHIANTLFDKQMGFAEAYLKNTHLLLINIQQSDGMNEGAQTALQKLYETRINYLVWIPSQIESKLIQLETKVKRMALKDNLLPHVKPGNTRTKIINDIEDIFRDMVGMSEKKDGGDGDILEIQKKIKDLLGIDKLTDM